LGKYKADLYDLDEAQIAAVDVALRAALIL
jgi:hypothetical protein